MPKVSIPAVRVERRPWLSRALLFSAAVGLAVLLVGIAMMSALAIGACG